MVLGIFFDGFGTSSAICVELSIVPMAKAGPTRPRMKLTPVGQPVKLVYSFQTNELVECVFGRAAMQITTTNHTPKLTNTITTVQRKELMNLEGRQYVRPILVYKGKILLPNWTNNAADQVSTTNTTKTCHG
jgi:hypothetical protein